MYYEGGISSVYAYDAEDKFVVVVLIKKGNIKKSDILRVRKRKLNNFL